MQLDKWPLSIVPFIMKGESFGSRVRGHDVATVHCLLTPSNNLEFNRYVYSKLDIKIESAMNLYWNSNSDHTVVYYGSSWKQRTPSGIPRFEYKDVERLFADLRNVPFICITPYFKESTGEFYFKVWIWGMGANTIDNRKDIFPQKELFCENYNSDFDFSNVSSDAISELSSYLVSMVGYLTDMYYWKMYQISPFFPSISCFNEICTNSKYIIDEYKAFLIEEAKHNYKSAIECYTKLIGYLPNHKQIASPLAEVISTQINGSTDNIDMESLRLASSFAKSLDSGNPSIKLLRDSIKRLTSCSRIIIKPVQLNTLSLDEVKDWINQYAALAFEHTDFLFTIWNESTIIGRFGDSYGNPTIFQNSNEQVDFIFYSLPVIDSKNSTLSFYNYNLKTHNMAKMKNPDFEKRFGEEFARIGRAFGRTIDSLGNPRKAESVWDSPNEPKEAHQQDSYEQVVNLFKIGVESNAIEYQHSDNLSIQTFLDWIDENNNPFATKVYIVKGYLKDHKKFIFCTFFANDERVFLAPTDKKKCFITSAVGAELAQDFGNNNLCVIPLTQ